MSCTEKSLELTEVIGLRMLDFILKNARDIRLRNGHFVYSGFGPEVLTKNLLREMQDSEKDCCASASP